MGDTVKRIKKYIDSKGISTRKFEESLGFSNGSFASQYKNNKTIGVDKVENILRVYSDINPEWLLTGKGTMLRKDKEMEAKVEMITQSNKEAPPSELALDECLLTIIKEKDIKIEEQAKTIGRLEERVETLSKKSIGTTAAGSTKGKFVPSASTASKPKKDSGAPSTATAKSEN